MAKSLLLVHLSLLLVSCFTVYGVDQNIVSFVASPPHHLSVTPAPAPSTHHQQSHPPPIASPAHAPPQHLSVTPAQAPSPHHQQSHPPPIASPAHAPPHHHHHSHPPALSPVHTPTHAPAHAPAHAPVRPPHFAPSHPPSHHFRRSLVEVQGVVYCKACKYAGADTLLGATPVPNATVKLECNNTKYPITVKQQTDKNGYFLVRAPKTITNYGAHKCKVFLVSSSSAYCQKPSNLHGGATGAILRPEKIKPANPPVALFTVGPLAFEPKCPHH